MPLFKVILEVDIYADTPFEAAKILESWIHEPSSSWEYYVQEENKTELFSIDMNEEDENAVLPVTDAPVFFN